jgi:hypothetical protein
MAASRRDFLHSSALAIGLAARQRLRVAQLAGIHQHNPSAANSRILAVPVPLDRVRLTGGPLQRAQQVTAQYLLSLDPDRMLAFYRTRAGLEPKAQPYDGWDGPGRNLTGHIAGHHLSAISYMFLATGDARFKTRADYMVRELDLVQRKNGDGYLSALENGRDAFQRLSKGEIRSSSFDLNGLWSPWYTLHKTFAGLRDAYRHTGNHTALAVAGRFAAWADNVLAPLDDAQIQRMLNTEFGGMNEVLTDLATDTGNRRWLDLSYRFEHRAFTDPLKRHEDVLGGKHVNCQIPKLIGSASRYLATGDGEDLVAASFFWDSAVQHHSYVTGGAGLDEYYGPADQVAQRVDGRAAESCPVYNMLKLTRILFSARPDAFYADYQETALFNHALASIDPTNGVVSYMVPVGRREQQEYQDMQHDWTCCCGTGQENHGLHGLGVYFESTDRSHPTIWVNVFTPSTAELASIDGHVTMETSFPDGDAGKLTLTLAHPRTFRLLVRRPWWSGDGYALKVNGEAIATPPLRATRGDTLPPVSTYAAIERAWQSGDVVEFTIPKSLRLSSTPDNDSVAAVMWGPLALAGDMGPRAPGDHVPRSAPRPPMLTAADRPLEEWITPGAQPGDFTIATAARALDAADQPVAVTLKPFYRTYERQYSVYWDAVTPAEFASRVQLDAERRASEHARDEATVALVQPGDRTQEEAMHYQSDPPNRAAQDVDDRRGRGGAGWFSYQMPTRGADGLRVIATFHNTSLPPGPAPAFTVSVDGTRVGDFTPHNEVIGFYDESWSIAPELARGKSAITVRFDAARGSRIPAIFAVRLVRTDPA